VLVLLNVPFALIGGAVGLWAMHMPLSIAAAVGFIALVGQASLNGVLVLSAIESKRKAGVPLDEAVLEGSRERLRAVLMTAALPTLFVQPVVYRAAFAMRDRLRPRASTPTRLRSAA
jgi:heavy metal efflux system protein